MLYYNNTRRRPIAAKDLAVVTDAVQKSGNVEYIYAILEYGNNAVLEKGKARLAAKEEERQII